MLRKIELDLVRLVLPVDPEWFSAVIDNLEFIAGEYGFNFKKVYQNHSKKWVLLMKHGNEQMTVAAYYVFKYRRIEYRFKGEVNYLAFQGYLLLLNEYGLANAMMYGRIKRLELAIDILGVHTKDLICHRGGLHLGKIVINEAGTGRTIYLGSRDGETQFAIYDKAQELKDKGHAHPTGDLLRVEIRLMNRKCDFQQLVEELYEDDPFRKFMITKRSLLQTEQKNLKNWHILLETCLIYGVPWAIKQFPVQRKTLLNALKEHTVGSLKPKLVNFEQVFGRFMLAAKYLDQLGHVVH